MSIANYVSQAPADSINPHKVFLVSGQMLEQKVGGQQGSNPSVIQRVVVADDAAQAIRKLEEADPSFRPLGHASLADYEDVVTRLRAVAEGRSRQWGLLVA